MTRQFRKLAILLLISPLLASTFLACGELEEEVDESHTNHPVHIADIEVFESNSGDVLVHSEGNQWHSTLPPFTVDGDRLSLKVNAFDDHHEALELDFDNHHDIRAHFADGAPELVEINHCMMRGCTIHLVPGAEAGETTIYIRVLEDGEEIYQSPPLPVVVVNPTEE